MQRNPKLLILVLVLVALYAIKSWYPSQVSPPQSQQSTVVSSGIPETASTHIARYVQQHQRLPDFYIGKNEARHRGWIASQGNLCDVLPGRVIGGDSFSNREHRLPEKTGRHWREADVNFQCGHRNSDRLLYSNDGLIFLTTDHYRSFKQVP